MFQLEKLMCRDHSCMELWTRWWSQTMLQLNQLRSKWPIASRASLIFVPKAKELHSHTWPFSAFWHLTFHWNFSGGGASWEGTEWERPWTLYTHTHKCTHTSPLADKPKVQLSGLSLDIITWEKSGYQREVQDHCIHSVKGASFL